MPTASSIRPGWPVRTSTCASSSTAAIATSKQRRWARSAPCRWTCSVPAPPTTWRSSGSFHEPIGRLPGAQEGRSRLGRADEIQDRLERLLAVGSLEHRPRVLATGEEADRLRLRRVLIGPLHRRGRALSLASGADAKLAAGNS